MDNHFEPLAIGEVLSIDESAQILIGHRTFRVGEFADAVQKEMQSIQGWTKEKDAWFSEEGVPCEVLRFTANGWQKGKVRIHLEFCPQDFEDKPKESAASVADASATAAVVDTSDDLELEDSLLDTSDDLALEDSLLDSSDDLDLDESPFSMKDELVPENLSSSLDDEFALDEPEQSTFFQQEEDAPSAVFIEVEQEVIILPGEGLGFDPMSTSFDDDLDLGEISQSIDQELELVDAPLSNDDDLLDLGDMSLNGNNDLDFGEMSAGTQGDFEFDEISVGGDDDLDFGEMSVGTEDDFQFEDISLSDDPEDKEDDSLLDDVWQDINQASWQNKP